MGYTVIKLKTPEQSIEEFKAKVLKFGIKIDEIENCQLWGHLGKTYLIEKDRRGLSRISVESWKSLKLNLEDDD